MRESPFSWERGPPARTRSGRDARAPTKTPLSDSLPACPDTPEMTVFRVAQPFGAAEQPPDVARTIWYFKSLHEVGMALSAGLKPRGDEEKVFFGQLVRTSIL